MDIDNHHLESFILNFFDNERFIELEDNQPDETDITGYINKPEGFQSDRHFLDHLLNDPVLLENVIDCRSSVAFTSKSDVGGSAKIITLKKRLPIYEEEDEIKVAASKAVGYGQDENAIRFADEILEGFIQMNDYKSNRFLISGHLYLLVPQKSLKLIFPDKSIIENFNEKDGSLTFKIVLKEKIDLTEIYYELF
jgi:hypothetical protein